mmetsp:Transcript_28253/g.85131  ORF Transcript_28253/g.85131 Transcript_28253/m.85131 type:complete len:232 (-) Transcript_28253:447-1142(-)
MHETALHAEVLHGEGGQVTYSRRVFAATWDRHGRVSLTAQAEHHRGLQAASRILGHTAEAQQGRQRAKPSDAIASDFAGLQHRVHLEVLRGEFQGVAVVPHGLEHHLPVVLEVLHGGDVSPHCCEHHLAVPPKILVGPRQGYAAISHGDEHHLSVPLEVLGSEPQRAGLLHGREHDLPVLLKVSAGKPQGVAVVLHGREHHLAVSLEVLGRDLQRHAAIPHGREYNLAVPP